MMMMMPAGIARMGWRAPLGFKLWRSGKKQRTAVPRTELAPEAEGRSLCAHSLFPPRCAWQVDSLAGGVTAAVFRKHGTASATPAWGSGFFVLCPPAVLEVHTLEPLTRAGEKFKRRKFIFIYIYMY